MQDGRDGHGSGAFRGPAANDNPGSCAGPEARIEDAVMRLARLLGRQIAREHFHQPEAANDSTPTGEAGER